MVGYADVDTPTLETVIVKNNLSWEVTENDVDWDEGGTRLNHPEESKLKILNENEAEARLDILQYHPPGYVAPEHTHPAAHAVMILDGWMQVKDGPKLTPGDYIFAQKEPHALEMPDGCLVFASVVGGSAYHDWTDEKAGVRE